MLKIEFLKFVRKKLEFFVRKLCHNHRKSMTIFLASKAERHKGQKNP
jgi:hypothetical protein